MNKYDLIGLLFVYMIPMFIAIIRHHKQKISVIILNLFLGWTFVGWIMALMWALSEDH